MTLRTTLALGGAVALLLLLSLDGPAQTGPPASTTPDAFPPIPPSAPPTNVNGASATSPFLVDALTGPMLFRGDYRAAWYPDARVAGQNTNLGLFREDLS